MRKSLIQISVAILALTSLLSFSSAASEDASVRQRLDSNGTKYEVDADGDFKITYSYKKENRTQLIFVSGKTESVHNLVIREIFSPTARIQANGFDGAKALELLVESRKNKLGSLEIEGDVLYFVIKLPDSISAAELEAAMDIAAETADDMELKLTGKDDL